MTQTILFAFPGMGKTTVCKEVAGLVDLDYGYFRSAVAKLTDTSFLTPAKALSEVIQHLTKIYCREGFNVLTNEPKLIPWLKQLGFKTVMVLPNPDCDMGKRMLDREKAHPVNREWAELYAQSWQQWVKDWECQAHKYGIKCIYVNYLYDDWNKIMKEVDNNA